MTRPANTPSRPVVMFRTPILLRNRLYRQNDSLWSYFSRKRKHISTPPVCEIASGTGAQRYRLARVWMSGEKIHDGRLRYRTSASAQLPRATTPNVSHKADSHRDRLFEGRQLIISVIASAPNFVIKCNAGMVTHACAAVRFGSVTVCGLSARFMLSFKYKHPRCLLWYRCLLPT